MDHDDLIRMLDSGDKEQFDEAINRIAKNITEKFFRWSYSKYGWRGIDDGDISDVFQETILEFLYKVKKSGTQIITSQIDSFIIGIAKYKWKEHFRKRSSKTEFPALFGGENDESNLEDELENEAWTQQALLGLEQLPDECQKLLKMHIWERKKCSEIVDEMPELGNANNCRQRKHSCLEKLRKLMGI